MMTPAINKETTRSRIQERKSGIRLPPGVATVSGRGESPPASVAACSDSRITFLINFCTTLFLLRATRRPIPWEYLRLRAASRRMRIGSDFTQDSVFRVTQLQKKNPVVGLQYLSLACVLRRNGC